MKPLCHWRRICEGYLPSSYAQYHTWELYLWGLKSKGFFVKNQTNTQNMDKGTHRTKISIVVLAEYPKCPPTFFGLICLPKPKSFKIFEKKNSLGVRLCPWSFRFNLESFWTLRGLLNMLHTTEVAHKELGLNLWSYRLSDLEFKFPTLKF